MKDMSMTQAIFLVTVGNEVDGLSLLPSIAGSSLSVADLHRLQQGIKLKVAWAISASGASHAVPALQLLLPQQLKELLGARFSKVLAHCLEMMTIHTAEEYVRIKGHHGSPWMLSQRSAGSDILCDHAGSPTGKVELPAWPQSGMCTVEYIPEVKARLQRSCQQVASTLSVRREFLQALIAAGLGELLESDEATCR